MHARPFSISEYRRVPHADSRVRLPCSEIKLGDWLIEVNGFNVYKHSIYEVQWSSTQSHRCPLSSLHCTASLDTAASAGWQGQRSCETVEEGDRAVGAHSLDGAAVTSR